MNGPAPLVAEMLEMLEQHGQTWTEEDRELAVRAAMDYGVLLGRQLAGEDVDRELEIATTTVRGLKTAGQYTTADLLTKAVHKWVLRISTTTATALLA